MGDNSYKEWLGIVCRHGLLLVEDARNLQKSVMMRGGDFDASQAREAKMILLGAPHDTVLLTPDTGELAQPPIRIRLSDELTKALAKPSFLRAVAMTHSGPRDPDKPCNQDFAVAVDLLVGTKAYSVAVVCDGVSQKVFWPERSSRIAGLAALQTLYGFLRAGPDRSLPQMVQAAITQAYRDDKLLLGDAPSLMFDKDYYARQRDREANWYQSTVLVAALGGDGGFVSYVGDGAIVDLPRTGAFNQALETTEDFGLDHCASLLLQAHEFAQPVRLPPGERTLLLATDGVDRTAAASGSRETFFRDAAGRIAAANQKDRGTAIFDYLEQLARLPYCASDNISIAWLAAPSPQSGGDLMQTFGTLLDPPAPPPPPPPLTPAAVRQPPPPPTASPYYFPQAAATGPMQSRTAGYPPSHTPIASSFEVRTRRRTGGIRSPSVFEAIIVATCLVLLVGIGWITAEIFHQAFPAKVKAPPAQATPPPVKKDLNAGVKVDPIRENVSSALGGNGAMGDFESKGVEPTNVPQTDSQTSVSNSDKPGTASPSATRQGPAGTQPTPQTALPPATTTPPDTATALLPATAGPGSKTPATNTPTHVTKTEPPAHGATAQDGNASAASYISPPVSGDGAVRKPATDPQPKGKKVGDGE